MSKFYKDLKVSGADWTYFAPAGLFEPGEKTGKFRLGKDDLITDASGNSRISMEDYAIAAVDELERASAPRRAVHYWVLTQNLNYRAVML